MAIELTNPRSRPARRAIAWHRSAWFEFGQFAALVALLCWVILRGAQSMNYEWKWARVPQYLYKVVDGELIWGPLMKGLFVTLDIAWQAGLLALAEKYAQPAMLEAVRRGEGLDDNGNGTGNVEDLDDYSRCKITRKEDFKDLYVKPYYFGCEADDPINSWAFNKKANPMGARLNALFSSDIGHFDVPDMTEVVPEAYELVEHGLIDENDFRDFMFENAVRFWGRVNPDFFKGTVVEKQAAEVLARPR